MNKHNYSCRILVLSTAVITIIVLLMGIMISGCYGQWSGNPTPSESSTVIDSHPIETETSAPADSIPQPSSPEEYVIEDPGEITGPTENEVPEPTNPNLRDEDFARVSDHIPGIVVELRYATADNFTGQQIYTFQDAYLRYGTVKKLQAVQADLQEQGLSLKIWDAFRPTDAQFKLWEICPNPNYVANPNKGFSSHSRGNTVDVTLVYADGTELEMPTGFDDFSPLANRDYSDCTIKTADNAKLLENLMIQHGFSGYYGEWWHFSDTAGYDVEKEFCPAT